MATSGRRRKWTDDDLDAPNKWLGVGLLGTIFLLGFGYLAYVLWPRGSANVHVAHLVIQDLTGTIPEPLFGESFIDVVDAASEWKLRSNSTASDDRSSQKIVSDLQSLPESLDGLKSSDTVILYVRAQVAVNDRKLYLINSEVQGVEDLTTDGLSLDEFVGEISKVKARSIIVLADFCDLATIPDLEVAFNNFEQPLKEALGHSGRSNLWFITSAAPGQPGHVSWKRQRSLLQSAVSYSLLRPRSQSLRLPEFYDSILRYAAQVTGGTQTPLLLSSGSRVDSTASELWEAAAAVLVDKGSVDAVAETDDDSNAGKEVGDTGAELDAGKLEPVESDESSVASERVEDDPCWRVWQLHDALRDRKVEPPSARSEFEKVGWAPVDFAPRQWQIATKQSSKATRLFLARKDREALMEFGRLQRLQQELLSGRQLASAEDELLKAWNSLLRELEQEGKSAWESPFHLAPEIERDWRQVRSELRGLADAFAQLAHHIDFRSARVEPEASELSMSPKSLSGLKAILKAIASAREQAELVEFRTKGVDLSVPDKEGKLLLVAAQKALSAAQVGSRRLNWSDEQLIQELLCSPMLLLAERKALYEQFSKLPVERMVAPGAGGVNMRTPLFDLLPKSSNEDYFEMISQLSNQVRGLGANGRGLFSNVDSQRLAKVSTDEGLWVECPEEHFLPQPLVLNISKRNGGPATPISLGWSSDADKKRSVEIRVVGQSGVVREGWQVPPKQVKVENRQFKLDIRDALSNRGKQDYAAFFGAERSRLVALKISWNGVVEKRVVRVYPPRPNQVSLYAKLKQGRVLGQDRDTYLESPEFAELKSINADAVIRGVGIPAIKDAKRTYEFFVANESEVMKTVKIDFFAVAGRDQIGNGVVTLQNAKNTRLSGAALYEGGIYKLLPDEEKQVLLRQDAVANDTLSSLEFGLVCRISEGVLEAADNQFVPNGRSRQVWIDIAAENPAESYNAKLENISVVRVEGVVERDAFSFKISTPQENLDELSLDEIVVEGFLTDAVGRPIDTQTTPISLTSKEPVQRLRLKPTQTVERSLIAHLNIGGYPRAIAFESDADLLDEPHRLNRAMLWLDGEKIELFEDSGVKFVAPERSIDQITIPQRKGANATSTGEVVRIGEMRVPFKVDFPSSGEQAVQINSELPQQFEFDRQFVPQIFIDPAGRLVLAGEAQDLECQIPVPRKSKPLTVHVPGSGVSKEVQVLVDKKKPIIDSFQVSGGGPRNRIGSGGADELEFTVEVQSDSKVAAVYYALDIGDTNSGGEYDAVDAGAIDGVAGRANSTPDRPGVFWWIIKADQLKGLRTGNYTVVCRVVDSAGNVQDRIESSGVQRRSRIYWQRE